MISAINASNYGMGRYCFGRGRLFLGGLKVKNQKPPAFAGGFHV